MGPVQLGPRLFGAGALLLLGVNAAVWLLWRGEGPSRPRAHPLEWWTWALSVASLLAITFVPFPLALAAFGFRGRSGDEEMGLSRRLSFLALANSLWVLLAFVSRFVRVVSHASSG